MDARERGLLAFAEKLTLAPTSVTFADTEALRGVGLCERAIVDLVQCVAYFGYANRVVAGLGAPLGAGEGPPGQ